jgi:hypothetical protein
MILLNFVLFQLAWFACVILAARGQQWLGIAAIAAAVAVYLWLAPRKLPAVQLLLVVTAIGLVWECLVLATGWMHYASAWSVAWLAPAWIVAMWTLFGTLLNVSLRWLRGRTWLSVLFGLVGGPMADYGGVKLGAVFWSAPVNAILLQGLGWAVLTPILISLARRFDV